MSHLPLTGLRVLVTRPEGDGANHWLAHLADAGAVPVPYPTVRIAPPVSGQALDDALARLASYDWIVFTSQNTVACVRQRLPDRRFPQGAIPRIAAVGAATAAAIEAAGGVVALLPSDSRQEGLMQALASLPGDTRLLLPIAEGGRTLLADSLRSRGCVVDVAVAYRTLPRSDLPAVPTFDVATFASPSALRAYLAHAGAASLAGKGVAVIGPTTAAEAVTHGIHPVVAQSPSIDDLISALTNLVTSRGEP
jgi:uroporphyrinogen-III synthase